MKYENDYLVDIEEAEIELNLPLFACLDIPTIKNATAEKGRIYITLDTKHQRECVFYVIKTTGHIGCTDNSIARVLNIPSSTVAARRSELIKAGKVFATLLSNGKKEMRKDDITGNSNVIWKAVI